MSDSIDPDGDVDDELSALEYARQSGICQDYKNDPTHSLTNIQSMINQNAKHGWIGDDDLPPLHLGQPLKVEERLTISKDAALMLASVARPDMYSPHETLLSSLLDDRPRKRLKEELPLLTYDPDIACQLMRQRDDFEISLEQIRLPLELVDQEKDEAIAWPKRSREFVQSLWKQLDGEKLAITREALPFLKYPTSCAWTPEDDAAHWSSITMREKKNVIAPITPPLMPLDKPHHPFEPTSSFEGFDIPLTSDPLDLGQIELGVIQEKAMLEDVPTPVKGILSNQPDFLDNATGIETVKMKDIYSPMGSLERSSPPEIEERRFRRDDLKVEGPLTPVMPHIDLKKSVSFASIALEYNYNAKTPSPMHELESRFFEEAFGPAHEKITRMCEQEQLSVADAKGRVKVPNIDLGFPAPPWKQFEIEQSRYGAKHAQLQLIKETLVEAEEELRVWPGARKAKDAVRWALTSSFSTLSTTVENFPIDDEAWKPFVHVKEHEVIDSSSQTWKPPGLRILKHEDDDDEDLEHGEFIRTEPEDMATLLRKRKIRMEEDGITQEQKGILLSSTGVRQINQGRPRAQNDTGAPKVFPGNLLGGPFSAGDAIDNFMEIRGAKKMKHGGSEFFAPTSVVQPQGVKVAQNQVSLSLRSSPALQTVTLPSPQFQIPQEAFSVVMSTTVSSWKNIVRTLERSLPTLTLIERDFSSHNTTAWLQGSVQRSPVASPLAVEADFIVSPCMGIIVTTLQKAKAKTLPGHKGKAEIRERVEKVSLRYEKLLVLVSEDNKAETTDGLYASDAEGLASFIGFTASLERNIIVQYVAGGSQNLYQWLIAAIVQNRVQETLLAEQTHWELFLRRAGMNAFAAQSVIALLRPPDGINASSPSKMGHFGLTAFVEMGRPARIARFAGICGTRMLERVSDMIDSRWE